jgi:hypothetical protein
MENAAGFDRLVIELSLRHPRFPRATIERLVARTAARYQHCAVTTFVHVLVRREVETQLRYVDSDGAAPAVDRGAPRAPDPPRPRPAPEADPTHRLPDHGSRPGRRQPARRNPTRAWIPWLGHSD